MEFHPFSDKDRKISGLDDNVTRRIGILGGTFDPIHIGHLVAALNAKYLLELDLVQMVVAHVPWQKVGSRAISPSHVRLAMVEAAVADVDGVEASGIEIERGGDSYTADTLAELAAAEPNADLFLLIGSDVVSQLHTWSRPNLVKELAQVVVLERPGTVGATAPPGWSVTRLANPRVDLSSTELRARMAEDLPVQFLVPDGALKVWQRWRNGES